jgi:transposase-like protein
MLKEIESLQALQEVPRAQRRPVAKPLDHYASLSPDLSQAMALAYLSGDYTLKAIADHFGAHYTTVSRAVKEYEATKNEM